MGNVAIMTDTIACLTPEIIERYDITLLPVALNINGEPYRDLLDLTPDEFWKKFPEIKEFTTGAPALSEYTDRFTEMAGKTDNIVAVFVSKALSAIYPTAVQAADLFKKENPNVNVEIVDSQTASGAEGFVVEAMAKAAAEGKTVAEIVETAGKARSHSRYVSILDTMKYIIKSGRAPKTAYMGELFQVKPIIGQIGEGGEVENLGRARGREKGLVRMLDIIAETIEPSRPIRVNVHYTNSREDGENLHAMVTGRFNCKEAYLTPFSPVMAGHTGPLLGVSFYQ